MELSRKLHEHLIKVDSSTPTGSENTYMKGDKRECTKKKKKKSLWISPQDNIPPIDDKPINNEKKTNK